MYHEWIYLKSFLVGKGKAFHKTITVMTRRKPLILDVRNPGEYKKGHLEGAVNISIDHLNAVIPELISKQKPVIVTSLKGTRSERATNLLKEAGVEAYDGGSWSTLKKW